MYTFIFIFQIGGYLVTGVLVLLAEAYHTLSDVLVSGFLLYALVWSRKPADQYHMFGHGRAQNVAALVSATLFIFVMSFETLREAVPRLLETGPRETQSPQIAIGVTVVAMLVSLYPLIGMLRVKDRGASLKAQLTGLLKDEVSYVSALIGLYLISVGYSWADPLSSIVVALIIAFGGVLLFRDNLHLLVGRSPGGDVLRTIQDTALSVEGVHGIHDLRAEYVGSGLIHADFHIEVDGRLSIVEANEVSDRVHSRLLEETDCSYCTVHVDYNRG